MKKAWALTKVYINSYYGISGLISDLKRDKKSALKKIGFLILILFSLSGILPMIVVMNVNMYKAMKPMNQQGLIITNSVISVSLFMLIVGLLGIIATYFIGKEKDIIFSMPLKPWQVFFSKFFINYLSEELLALVFMIPTIIIYGTNEGEGIVFYIVSLLIILFVPLIPMSICYFVLIPVMKFANFVKNKDTMMLVSGFLAIAFALGIQMFSKVMINIEKNPGLIVEKMTSPNGLVAVTGRIYYPSIIATNAMIDYNSISGLVNLFIFLVISSAVAVLLLTSMSKNYYNSNLGSDEVKKKERRYSEKQMKEKLKRKGTLISLLQRERRLMNREPVYLINGPLSILIMPLILGGVFIIQKDTMEGIKGLVNSFGGNANYYLTILIAGLSAFMAMTGNPSSSSVSRDGKSFMFIKSLPIRPEDYVNAKLLHAGEISALAGIVTCILTYFIFKLPLLNYVLAFIISNLVVMPMIIIGVLVDISWPKLGWDDPVKAMKQNFNVVIVLLPAMFIILPLLGLLVYFFLKQPLYGYSALIFIPLVLSIVLYKILIAYAKKRYYNIEV